MWIQLLSRQHLDIEGIARIYQPGDWVEIGKSTAMRLLLEGAATTPDLEQQKLDWQGAGIVVRGDVQAVRKRYPSLNSVAIPITDGGFTMEYDRTLLLDSEVPLRVDLLPVGFRFLEKWDIAAPLFSYDKLACEVGLEGDDERTEKIIRDLRVPLYDTRVLFLRRSETTERLMSEWRLDRLAVHTDERLSFLRSVYKIKPLILALPTTWTQPRKQGSR